MPVRTRFETEFEVPWRTVHPDDVLIDARFTGPSGAVVATGGFASHGKFRVRFTPREPGRFSYVIRADGGSGPREVLRGSLRATPSWAAGFVSVDPKDHHRLVRDDGDQVFMLGENRIDVYDPSSNYGEVGARTYIGRMASFGMSTLRVLFVSDCMSASGTASGGHPVGCLEPTVGRFDEETADAFDAIFEAGEHFGVDVIPVAFARPEKLFTSPASRPHAVRRLRYIADRWASSTRFLAIDLLDEPARGGPLPEAGWAVWAAAMSKEWRKLDPWKHLVMTGAASDERIWYASSDDDVVQWRLHGKGPHVARAVALEMRRKVDETYGFDKPVLCGDLAHGVEDWRTYDHTHNGIWAALLSGAGALAHSAQESRIDADQPMTPERGVHFQVLSGFLQRFGKKPLSRRHDVRVVRGAVDAWSLATDDDTSRALWVLGGAKGYGAGVSGVELAIPSPAGRYAVTWIDDTSGAEIARIAVETDPAGEVILSVPPFLRHVAASLVRE